MPAVTIRNLSEEVHRALKARAARHDRSTEAEMRAILEDAVRPPERVKVGSLLMRIGRDAGGSAGGVELNVVRDTTASDPVDLS